VDAAAVARVAREAAAPAQAGRLRRVLRLAAATVVVSLGVSLGVAIQAKNASADAVN